jgi:hypothetical protein
MPIEVICLEEPVFYALVEKVYKRLKVAIPILLTSLRQFANSQ